MIAASNKLESIARTNLSARIYGSHLKSISLNLSLTQIDRDNILIATTKVAAPKAILHRGHKVKDAPRRMFGARLSLGFAGGGYDMLVVFVFRLH
jgi:hypothetical protein